MRKDELGIRAIATIDRVTRAMLEQLELQTEAALNLLANAPEEKRDELLARIADLRGRLVRLRTDLIGPGRPTLIAKSKGRARGDD
jgi:hypothetical protein